MRGTMYGVTLHLQEKDAYKTGLSCHGTKSQQYAFFSQMAVRKCYPTIDDLVETLLINEEGGKVVYVNILCRRLISQNFRIRI